MSTKPNVMHPKGFDNYSTPPEAIEPLIPYLRKDWNIWDCACGNGALLKTLQKYVLYTIGTDVNPYIDVDRGYIFQLYERFNFLNNSKPPSKLSDIDVIITNPPYSQKDEFITKCYEIGKPFALLMPLTALEGIKRISLYKKYGIDILQLDKRINFDKAKKSSAWFHVAWFTWRILPTNYIFWEK